MNTWNQNSRNDDNKHGHPPYSRLFVVCSKDLQEEDLRGPFEKYGEIEKIYMPKDRNTGEPRGVAYIKFLKTSSAAAAMKALHMTSVKEGCKPMKVIIAVTKSDNSDNNINEEKLNRLFIKIPKQATDTEIREHFLNFGQVESVHIQKDRSTDESRGLAYVQFKTFLDTAKAYEECDQKYKPVFAAPKNELKRNRDSSDFNDSFRSFNSNTRRDHFVDFYQPRDDMPMQREVPFNRTPQQNYNTVFVTCNPRVSQKHIQQLCNIVPGMLEFKYSVDSYNGSCKAVVTYEDDKYAAYALERLHNFEFPSGEVVSVKPDDPLSKAANDLTTIVNSFKHAVDAGSPDLTHLADAIAKASTLIKAATSGRVESKQSVHDPHYCSVTLPSPQPMASGNSRVVQRCFIVCKPQPPPIHVLKDVFCRFGDLIDISTFPNKTFGFAKYASARAARQAMSTLHDAVVYGARLKVLEADEKPPKDDDKMIVDSDQTESIIDSKRMRHDDEDEC